MKRENVTHIVEKESWSCFSSNILSFLLAKIKETNLKLKTNEQGCVREMVKSGPLKILCSIKEIITLGNIFRITFQNLGNYPKACSYLESIYSRKITESGKNSVFYGVLLALFPLTPSQICSNLENQ